MFTLSYEYKLKATDQQVEVIEHTLNTSRSVWNYALREKKIGLIIASVASNFAPLNGKTSFLLTSLILVIKGKLRVLQKKVNTNLKSVNAQLLQQVLKSLDRAFADMKKKKLGFPRFKKNTVCALPFILN